MARSVTPLWLQRPTFHCRNRFRCHVNATIPMKLIRPSKKLKAQLESNKVEVIRSRIPLYPRKKMMNDNKVDTFHEDASYGFITRSLDNEKKSIATLTFLEVDEVKDIIVNPDFVPSERCGLVRLNKEGDVSPVSVPDFGDFAAFPLALKIAFKWMFKNNRRTLAELKELWLKCSLVLPMKRNEARLSFGRFKWVCHSMSSRVQMFKVCKPSSLDVEIECQWDCDSLCSMDGWEYVFRLNCEEKVKEENKGGKFTSISKLELHILVWNCQGVTRDSYKGNLHHLLKAHRPDVVVLLETRTSHILMKSQLRVPNCRRVDTTPPSHIFGGIAVMSINERIEFVRRFGGPKAMVGSIKGVAA